MNLKLEKPILFFDLETTGVDREKDRIVEIAICKYQPSGQIETYTRRINPEIPIPKEASDVHGITNADVENEPKFRQLAKGLLAMLQGCDIAGFNSNAFDVPLLFFEFARNGHYWDYTQHRMIDVGNIFKIKEPRTLSAAVRYYLGRDLEDAHSAKADIEATVEVFLAQMEKYEDLPSTIDELALFSNFDKKIVDISGRFSYDKNGEIVFNFGKHKGQLAKDHPSFLEWMIMKADFPRDTVEIATRILEESDPYAGIKPY